MVSTEAVGEADSLLWVVMITSAENRGWVGDVLIGPGHTQAGLPIPSVVRSLKIAVIEAARADAVGQVSPETLRQVLAVVQSILGFAA